MALKIPSGNYYDSRSYLKDTEFRNFYLDTTRFPKFNKSRGIITQVPAQCEYRIDLFSYQQYGSSRLWWVIAMANADIIKDPIWDFKSGMTVFVPREADIIEKMPGAE